MADWAMVTDGGTVRAEGVPLERVILAPPAGAALESVTVQVVVEDAVSVLLAHCSEFSVTGATNDRFAVLLIPFIVPVMVAA